MKGDFTRSTFRPNRRYQSVRMQQGRVQLDADWNEQVDIQVHYDEATRTDVIGRTGLPMHNGGFGLTALPGPDLAISSGRLYVDGTLCELDPSPVAVDALTTNDASLASLMFDGRDIAVGDWVMLTTSGADEHPVRVTDVQEDDRVIEFAPPLPAGVVTELLASGAQAQRLVSYTTQDDYPSPTGASPSGTLDLDAGDYLAYLDVWRRHVTALEDPTIREVALGGPDTATRVQTVCQVKLVEIPEDATGVGCDVTWPDWERMVAGSTGRMRARAEPEAETGEPCELPPRAGYRRLENQLYRVEVHDAGDLGTATFKWSRDNGSVVATWIGQPTTTELQLGSTGKDQQLSFAPGELAELTDDGRELRGESGQLVAVVKAEGDILEIATPVDITTFGAGAKVRRWNCTSLRTVDVAADNDGYVALEDGVEIRFEPGSYATGDHWLIPARTLAADIEWPRDEADRPDAVHAVGIDHAHAKLALVEIDAEGVPEVGEDCRTTFPALTEICADDVCFDNAQCAVPNAVTVQDALDFLCDHHDNRFHNKHLHGWGVVCGLQVHCVDGDRSSVVVHDGYAIDCEGRDIVVADRIDVPVMEMIDELGDDVLEDGKGDVCLTLALDDELQTTLSLERFDPNGDDLKALLDGTLLMDIYENCIRNVQEFLENELRDEDDDEKCAGAARQRLAALTNVVTPAVNQESGHSIYVSRAEHEMVLGFYQRLRDLLSSETYCAMFDNARPYPDYPLDDVGLRTIYGKGFHTRLRARPNSREVYTVGAGVNPLTARTRVNRYDLDTDCLIGEIDPLAGADVDGTDTGVGAVEDVAFSPDGRTIYVIAQARAQRDTYFRSGQFVGTKIVWGPLATLCGVDLVTLATTSADPGSVYAIGLADVTSDDEDAPPGGLYRIDPAALVEEPAPLATFNAVGHLELTADGLAATTASSGEGNSAYDEVLLIDISTGNTRARVRYGDAGTDDIALHTRAQRAPREAVYAVIGEGNAKRVVAHDLVKGAPITLPDGSAAEEFVEDTTVRLQPITTGLLLRSLEDHFSVRLLDPDPFTTVGTAIPMQVGPIAMTVTDKGEVVVLNFASNTLIVADQNIFDPAFKFPHDALATYRRQALEAFVDLAGGFLQYVKDCAVGQAQVQCPECDTDSTLSLAVISIRDDKVYKVCNFSKRREVKTWPKVGYWASIVPIMPLLDRALEWFACLVLPDLFGRYDAPKVAEVQHTEATTMHFATVRGGVATSQAFDIRTRASNIASASRDAGNLTVAGLAMRGGFARALAPSRPRAGVPVPGRLAVTGASPTRTPAANEVNPLAPLFDVLRTLGGTPRAPVAPPGEDLRDEMRNLAVALAAREAEVASLRSEVERHRAMRTELDELRARLDAIGR